MQLDEGLPRLSPLIDSHLTGLVARPTSRDCPNISGYYKPERFDTCESGE